MTQDRAPETADEPEQPTDESAVPPKTIPAGELFGNAREVLIEFHGERYRLRITRRNKLILQK